ncbi:MAG: GtrA family protein [Acidovorax sp.]|nr:GtrA family protein [Acidovorax sp.]
MRALTKLFRYGVVGIIGAVTHMSTLFLLVELHVATPVVATTMGFLLALITSYWINRLWTFGYKGSYWSSMARYGIVSFIGLGLNILIIKLCTDVLGLWYGWGAFAAVVAVALNNFVLNNIWTFSHRPSSPSP